MLCSLGLGWRRRAAKRVGLQRRSDQVACAPLAQPAFASQRGNRYRGILFERSGAHLCLPLVVLSRLPMRAPQFAYDGRSDRRLWHNTTRLH
eukprot:849521-Pyramimonas_sp.AAC.1